MRLLICTQAVDRNDPILGFFHRWIEEFAKHCTEVLVVCLFEGDHALPSNVRIFSLGKEKLSGSAQSYREKSSFMGKMVLRVSYARRFLHFIWRTRRQYDGVFVHMNPEYIALAGPLWRVMGKRVVLWYTHKATPLLLRLALPLVDRIFTASPESFRLVSSKVSVTGHGIDVERFMPPRKPPSGTVRLITSGRITPIKGLDVLIEAFLLLKKRNVKATFSIIGRAGSSKDRLYEETLRAQLTEAGEEPEKVFEGSLSHAQMPERRTYADYFLHASETGSLDKAVLDAVMSGVLPISSSEAYEELFMGYEALLHCSRGDSAALAARIISLEALSETRREEIRKALRERVVRGHSLAGLVQRILTEFPESKSWI